MIELRMWLADIGALLGCAAISLALYGLVRVPDPAIKIHAASKGLVLGTLVILGACAIAEGTQALIPVGLVALFLLVTAPVATHALIRAHTVEQSRRPRR